MVLQQISNIIKDPSSLKKLFGSTPTLIDSIVVDVLLAENPIYAWDLTSHPVEAGLNITDSRYQKPVGVSLDCIFCDPEFSVSAIAGDLANAIISGGSLSDANPFAKANWQEKRDALFELQNQNKIFDCITPNGEYNSVMITAVRPTFTKDKTKAFFFRIELTHVETVSSDIVAIDDSQIPEDLKAKKDAAAAAKTAKKTNAGKKTTETAGKKKESILNKLIGKYL